VTFLFANHHVVLKVRKIFAAPTKKVTFFSKKAGFLEASETYQSSSVYQLEALRHADNWVTLRNCITYVACPVPHRRMNIRSYP
jgi:hypothetical protein